MDEDDKAARARLIDAIVEMTSEFRVMRTEQKERDIKPPNITINTPRVSFDTVLLSLMVAMTAAATFYACVSP